MKRNAIARIIIWSIVIVLLVFFLYMMIAGVRISDISSRSVPFKQDNPATNPEIPSWDIGNQPQQPGQDIEGTSPSPGTDPGMWEGSKPENNPDHFAYDSNSIHQLEILWTVGNVRILRDDVDKIIISETNAEETRYQMRIREQKGKLTIRYNGDDEEKILFGIRNYPEKELTILVPMDWDCQKLDVDAAAANVEVSGLTIGSVEFDGASGNCIFYDTTIGNLDMDTASGAISYHGKLNTLDCDAASADITAILLNSPRSIDVDTASGNLDLTLPVDCGFTVKMDGFSTRLESEFLTTEKNGIHTHGDGGTKIEMDSMSGDVILRVGKDVAVPMN